MCIITAGIAAGISSLGLGAVTAGEVSTGLGVLGTVGQVFGSIGQGNAMANMASYNAQVARNNQTIASQNASYAIQAGEQRAVNQGLTERQRAGAITSGLAAHGIDINTGSAADVRTSQAELGQEDVETVRHDAALRAYGYRTQATGFGAEAQLDTAQAGYERQAGWLRGLGSLLSSGAKFLPVGGGGFDPTSVTSMWGGGGEAAVAAGYRGSI